MENGVVRTAPGFSDGYKAIADGGWIGVAASSRFGGMGLPLTIQNCVNEMLNSSCLSLALNPLMTQGQIEALEHHASEEIKSLYLPKLITGEWSGTMNLTELQAGSDVGALTTKAKKNELNDISNSSFKSIRFIVLNTLFTMYISGIRNPIKNGSRQIKLITNLKLLPTL